VKHENDYFSVRRTSFLATPGDTKTVYAAQGSTFDAVIADMQRPPNLDTAKHWLACYVMMSRARSLEGFLVLRPATRKELSARPPQYLLDEIERMLRLEDRSLAELIQYINDLPTNVPAEIMEVLAVDAAALEEKRVEAHRKLSTTDDNAARTSDAPKRRLTKKTPDAGAADENVGKHARTSGNDEASSRPSFSTSLATNTLASTCATSTNSVTETPEKDHNEGAQHENGKHSSIAGLTPNTSSAQDPIQGMKRTRAEMESSANVSMNGPNPTADERQTSAGSLALAAIAMTGLLALGSANSRQDVDGATSPASKPSEAELRAQAADKRKALEPARGTEDEAQGVDLQPSTNIGTATYVNEATQQQQDCFGANRAEHIRQDLERRKRLQAASEDHGAESNKPETHGSVNVDMTGVSLHTSPTSHAEQHVTTMPHGATTETASTEMEQPSTSAPLGLQRPLEATTHPSPASCTTDSHICPEDCENGCRSCGRTCHTNCNSPLCTFTPCLFCFSFGDATHSGSDLCLQRQRSHGSHGDDGHNTVVDLTESSSSSSRRQCRRFIHICFEDRVNGCTACSKTCHADPSNTLCAFYGRARGALDWQPATDDLQDTRMHVQELGGNVRHRTQFQWRKLGRDYHGSRAVLIDGAYYFLGFSSGSDNNCFVHTLRQCLNIVANVDDIRLDLMLEFHRPCGPTCHERGFGFGCTNDCSKVYKKNFLTTDHWQAVVRQLGRHSQTGSVTLDPSRFRIRVLELIWEDNGVVLGDPNAATTLTIAREHGNHFIPVLPYIRDVSGNTWEPW
jgi:hypothetical protein